ncbi:hypothetical protein [Parapedobacter koreensis]|nr:hypothetical protein [Parapedobacter koreensis]
MFLALCTYGQRPERVYIQHDNVVPQATYAARKLEEAILNKGYLVGNANESNFQISLLLDTIEMTVEAFSIRLEGNQIRITGGDVRGLIYGSLSVVEDLENGIALKNIKEKKEHPHLSFRAIKFNLPWDAYREGYAMELHLQTCKDLGYWETFLDMMVENRFNTLTLWNLHPFPYMIRPRNFPEASPFDDQEMAAWQTLYRGLFRLAKERGIETYIVNWNIFVTPTFAKAHGVSIPDGKARIHYGMGDTAEVIKRYTRECVTQVLEEYPDLTGIGFTHGEAMRGMSPKERQDWFETTILEGMKLAKRRAKLIHRVPLEVNSEGSESGPINVEQLTRESMEKIDYLEKPIWAEVKFNWSHGHSSTKLIKVHGGQLSDTYFKPEPENYKIAWMVRNEDFFCLRWGVPDFIRKHIATNNYPYVGGYFVGSEGYIPAKDYFSKPNSAIQWKYAFQRQWLFYKLWGRLLYNPATPDVVFQSEFIRRYGMAGEGLLEASALSGKTPLRLASSFDFTWDFSLYSEGFLAMEDNEMRFISIDRQINQLPADSSYMSVYEYVNSSKAGKSIADNRITPLLLAGMLETDCGKALALVQHIDLPDGNPLLYEVADIKIWANLGLYFAQKLRGAVALQTYRLLGGEQHKQQAIGHLKKALGYWDEVVGQARPLYRDMPLAAYAYPHEGVRNATGDKSRFHWERLRPDVERDIEIARNSTYLPAK